MNIVFTDNIRLLLQIVLYSHQKLINMKIKCNKRYIHEYKLHTLWMNIVSVNHAPEEKLGFSLLQQRGPNCKRVFKW